MLSADECIDYLLGEARLLCAVEAVPTSEVLGRVLAETPLSTVNVPPLDNSAMDGYAVRLEDLSAEATTLPISQRIAAGQVGQPLQAGTAARIFTGAPVPQGADVVVMQEQCDQHGDSVIIKGQHRIGQNIRRAGEDLKRGDPILQPGSRLRPQDMGQAASAGLATLPVYSRLKIAIFSTGDELINPGEAAAAGQIYNSNRFTLMGLLGGLGAEIIDLGTCPDTLKATLDTLQQAASQADVIITSGGVSVGEEDYIKAALDELGEVAMWRVAMKPGKPLAYGRVGETPFIGLPGNPVSTFVTFCLFARPYLLKSMGGSNVLPHQISVSAGFDSKRAGPRREYVRARLEHIDGKPTAVIYQHQGSGVLTSTVWADGIVILPENTAINRGDSVEYISFEQLIY